jgi:uncharacterized protein YwqG
VIDEARQWKLLAQINNDPAADMRWGDFGALYWFIRPDDLERRRFDAAMFAWQTG